MYKEKGSKFIAFAYPVRSEEEVKAQLDLLKKEYYDARHHCYAYILGSLGQKYRANDDGEPNHSAGDPILGQIRSRALTNTLVVVVRYFGGTKLGVSGLITAYKVAAAEALDKAGAIDVAITDMVKIWYPYEKTSEVMRLVGEFNIDIIGQTFTEMCELTGTIAQGLSEELRKNALQMGDVKLSVTASHD